MDLGALLRIAREACGLTQEAVAASAGVSRHALSRWELGVRPVRSDVADRVLAACGKDVRFQLVARHADLDGTLTRLAALPVSARMREVRSLLGLATLDQLQETGAVRFTAAWAAAALGLPFLQDVGGFVVGPDPSDQARVAAVLRPISPLQVAPGGPWSVIWNDEVFVRHPAGRWHSMLLGEFTTEVVEDPVPEVRLDTDGGPWRVAEPSQLVPEHVDQQTVDRWRRRAT